MSVADRFRPLGTQPTIDFGPEKNRGIVEKIIFRCGFKKMCFRQKRSDFGRFLVFHLGDSQNPSSAYLCSCLGLGAMQQWCIVLRTWDVYQNVFGKGANIFLQYAPWREDTPSQGTGYSTHQPPSLVHTPSSSRCCVMWRLEGQACSCLHCSTSAQCQGPQGICWLLDPGGSAPTGPGCPPASGAMHMARLPQRFNPIGGFGRFD